MDTPKPDPVAQLERDMVTIFANAWNMGGMVAIAELDVDSSDRLWEVAKGNALAQAQKALNRYMEATADA